MVAKRDIWIIRYVGPDFDLFDGQGIRVLTGPKPKKLSIHAFVHGADEVCHDYDLRLAE